MPTAKKAPPLKIELQITAPRKNDEGFAKLSYQEYYELLEKLVSEGISASKKGALIAFPLTSFGIETLSNAGTPETLKEFPFAHHLVFDESLYTVKQAAKVTRAVFKAYGNLIVSAPDELLAMLNNGKANLRIIASAEGFWTMTNENFLNDYEPDQKIRKKYTVKPGTSRLCMPVETSCIMPVWWGDFTLREGGTLAARMNEIPELVSALNEIRSGASTIEDVLFTSEGKARFDVYGMNPGFFKANFEPTKVPDEALQALTSRQRPDNPAREATENSWQRRLLGDWTPR